MSPPPSCNARCAGCRPSPATARRSPAAPNFAYELCVRQGDRRSSGRPRPLELAVGLQRRRAGPRRHPGALRRNLRLLRLPPPAPSIPATGWPRRPCIVAGGAGGAAGAVVRSVGARPRWSRGGSSRRPRMPSGARPWWLRAARCCRAARWSVVDPETRLRCAAGEVGEIWVAGPSVAQATGTGPRRPGRPSSALSCGHRRGSLPAHRRPRLPQRGRAVRHRPAQGPDHHPRPNHYPQDIERTVEASHPALRPAAARPSRSTSHGEERLVVVQEVRREHRRTDSEEIVAGHPPRPWPRSTTWRCTRVVLLQPASIPKTSSGKIQRHACRADFLAESLKVVAEWRRDAAGAHRAGEEAPGTAAAAPAAALSPAAAGAGLLGGGAPGRAAGHRRPRDRPARALRPLWAGLGPRHGPGRRPGGAPRPPPGAHAPLRVSHGRSAGPPPRGR